MKFPCELVVWRILPSIRAKLAVELAKDGMSQRKIADKLGITEAAVSQYINKKRASDFKISSKLDKAFDESAGRIKKGDSEINVISEACKLCKEIRSHGFACEMHRETGDVPAGCKICFAGGEASEC
jgi:predicted transcriptional regulator